MKGVRNLHVMVSDDDCAARALAARRMLRQSNGSADGVGSGLPDDFLEIIHAGVPVVRDDVVADARARLANVELPSAEEVADCLVGDLIAARPH